MGLVFLAFMLRWFGEGRGILRGLILAVISHGLTNGVAVGTMGGVYLYLHQREGIDPDVRTGW